MKVLEKEIQLREETRALDQTRAALERTVFAEKALELAETQDELALRIGDVVYEIIDLPEGQQKFQKEIRLLSLVEAVMDEARLILASPDTGPEAIAAETQAIELLLQAKRINPNGGGGGGGSSPGGGGGGTTDESALALLGAGKDDDANIEDRTPGGATGVAGRNLPEEFRNGLDDYFGKMEGKR